MQAVVSPVLLRPAVVPESIAVPSPAESPIQSFCRLQIQQVLSQLPNAGIRLVCQVPEQSKRQLFSYGQALWSNLNADTQAYLAAESWWSKNSVGRLQKMPIAARQSHSGPIPVLNVEQSAKGCRKDVQAASYLKFLYVCSIHSSQPEYLLIAASEPLTINQKQLIENAANLLNYHFATVRKLSVQRQAQQQLEQKNHHIEHQIKSPIALIQIYAKILLSTELPELSRSHLESIQSSIQDISRHINQFSVKQKPLRIEQHDLSKIFTQSIKQLQPWLTEKQLTVKYSRSPMLLDVDQWQLKQVFDNLITNAIYFSPMSSTIQCTWQSSPEEVLIELSDQGNGLSEADLERVFMPFYSRRSEGTGLGLSIAQKIIQAHQGRIWVSNLPTVGAKFSFILPRQQPKLSIVPAIEAAILVSSS